MDFPLVPLAFHLGGQELCRRLQPEVGRGERSEKPSAAPWSDGGNGPAGKPWENHGKTVGNVDLTWENHGKRLGNADLPWENHGKCGLTIGKS